MAVYRKGLTFFMMSKAQKKRLLIKIVREHAGAKVLEYMSTHTTTRIKYVFASISLMIEETIKFDPGLIKTLVDDVRFEMNWRVV